MQIQGFARDRAIDSQGAGGTNNPAGEDPFHLCAYYEDTPAARKDSPANEVSTTSALSPMDPRRATYEGHIDQALAIMQDTSKPIDQRLVAAVPCYLEAIKAAEALPQDKIKQDIDAVKEQLSQARTAGDEEKVKALTIRYWELQDMQRAVPLMIATLGLVLCRCGLPDQGGKLLEQARNRDSLLDRDLNFKDKMDPTAQAIYAQIQATGRFDPAPFARPDSAMPFAGMPHAGVPYTGAPYADAPLSRTPPPLGGRTYGGRPAYPPGPTPWGFHNPIPREGTPFPNNIGNPYLKEVPAPPAKAPVKSPPPVDMPLPPQPQRRKTSGYAPELVAPGQAKFFPRNPLLKSAEGRANYGADVDVDGSLLNKEKSTKWVLNEGIKLPRSFVDPIVTVQNANVDFTKPLTPQWRAAYDKAIKQADDMTPAVMSQLSELLEQARVKFERKVNDPTLVKTAKAILDKRDELGKEIIALCPSESQEKAREILNELCEAEDSDTRRTKSLALQTLVATAPKKTEILGKLMELNKVIDDIGVLKEQVEPSKQEYRYFYTRLYARSVLREHYLKQLKLTYAGLDADKIPQADRDKMTQLEKEIAEARTFEKRPAK